MVHILKGAHHLNSAEHEDVCASGALAGGAARKCSARQGCSLPKALIVRVPQVAQDQSWDCGLACVLMVLQAAGTPGQDLSLLHALFPGKSVWTVDLAHILRQSGLAVQFTTLTLGMNPGFAAETFYGRMHEDELRVDGLFQAAAAAGIAMQQRSVPTTELQQLLLAGQHLVIALVDKARLERGLAFWSDFPQSSSSDQGYKGHYVLLCGFDSETEHFVLRDPDPRAAAMGLCSVKSVVFDEARRAFGTDEDLLFVSMPPRSL